VIRPAKASDAHGLASLHIVAWQYAYRDQFSEEFLDGLDIETRTAWFTRQIESGSHVLVAEADDEPAGFSFFGESNDIGWGEVFAIYVHPDSWGDGHGYELLRASEKGLESAGFARALLWVLAGNTRARSFYERQGWALGKPIRLEEIGGIQVTEVRYERILQSGLSPHRGHLDASL
jgi:GNAT superfamily N-acetyltransferase